MKEPAPARSRCGRFNRREDRTIMKSDTKQYSARILTASILLTGALITLAAPHAVAAEDEAVGMIVELIAGSDKDMQTMAIDQIRKQSLGKAATLRFAGLLEKLAPDVQAKLIAALGDRGDAAARPAILKMQDSRNEAVRIAAADALSALASPDDIPVLAKQAAAGSDAEKLAARNTLRTLKGEKMDAAMIAALKDADAKTKIELIAALTDRNVKASLPTVIKSVADPDKALRITVLEALGVMADETYAQPIVTRLKAAKDRAEIRKAALALMFTCRRGGAKCADAVIAGFKGSDATVRILLMRALTEAGGPKSLAQVVAGMKDEDKSVRNAALRTLTGWPDPAAAPHLKKLAGDVENLREHILAIRGLIRLGSPAKDRPGDLTLLSDTLKLASRVDEKRLVLSAFGTIPTKQSLAAAASFLGNAELAENAAAAVVMIAEKITDSDKDELRAAVREVIKVVKSEKIKARAEKVLAGL